MVKVVHHLLGRKMARDDLIDTHASIIFSTLIGHLLCVVMGQILGQIQK